MSDKPLEIVSSFSPLSSRLPKSKFDQNGILKALRSQQVNLHTRLLSIEHDARRTLTLYTDIVATGPTIPLFANARAGAWYVPPLPTHPTDLASFKSADGHYGQWASSPRRPNLHVLRAAVDHGAVVIVDVTRSGKRIPDSLSKTVPIWCAVINTLIAESPCHCTNNAVVEGPCVNCLAEKLFLHPSIPPSERAQILSRIPHFVDAWVSADMHAHPHILRAARKLAKPLRPIWVQPCRPVWDNGVPLPELDFTPVICLSASDAVAPGERALVEAVVPLHTCGVMFPSRPTFPYVQGAGDDEEAWANCLTPDSFWRSRDLVLPIDDDSRNQVETTLQRVRNVMSSPCTHESIVPPIPVWLSKVSIAQLPPGAVSSFIESMRDTFTSVIVLGANGPQGRQLEDTRTTEDNDKNFTSESTPFVHYEALTDRRGKLEYKYAFGRALGPCLSVLRECCVDQQQQALICCTSRIGDWTAGLTIAWLLWHCTYDADEEMPQRRRFSRRFDEDVPLYKVALDRRRGVAMIKKRRVHAAMMHFLSTFPHFQLSRATLKQLNRFFSSPSPSSGVSDE